MRTVLRVKFDPIKALELLNELIFNLENVYMDSSKRLYFYGGNSLPKRFNTDKIISLETPNNIEYINLMEKRIMKVFKNNNNWCNQRKSQRRVCQMLIWIIKQITSNTFDNKQISLKDYKAYTITKYFLPIECKNIHVLDDIEKQDLIRLETIESNKKKLKLLEDEMLFLHQFNDSLLTNHHL